MAPLSNLKNKLTPSSSTNASSSNVSEVGAVATPPNEPLPEPIVEVLLKEWDTYDWQHSADAITSWLNERCYDQPTSYFRAIRPQLATVPLALRDLLLMAKGMSTGVPGKGKRQAGEGPKGEKAPLRPPCLCPLELPSQR